jgi:hypothetical protein
MSRSKDPLLLRPAWHVDYRIEAELPEDTVVGRRFLINIVFSALALSALYFFGLKFYVTWSLKHQIGDWERRIRDNRAEVAEIERLQKDYTFESMKVDQAFTLVRPILYVSDFIANLGRTRPEQMSIDLIEWNEYGGILRGNLRERSEQATRILGGYLDTLRKDDKIGPLFQAIQMTNVERSEGGGVLRFEIKFTLKEKK